MLVCVEERAGWIGFLRVKPRRAFFADASKLHGSIVLNIGLMLFTMCRRAHGASVLRRPRPASFLHEHSGTPATPRYASLRLRKCWPQPRPGQRSVDRLEVDHHGNHLAFFGDIDGLAPRTVAGCTDDQRVAAEVDWRLDPDQGVGVGAVVTGLPACITRIFRTAEAFGVSRSSVVPDQRRPLSTSKR